MGDVKWVKFEVDMYDDTKLKILDHMDNRDLNHYVWARSLVLAGKINRGGYLYITDNMPYTIKTLAIEFNRSVDEIKAVFKSLRKLEMIEFTEDKVFKIKNWDKHQNIEGMERARQLNNERVAKHRAKKKEINEKNNEEKANSDVQEIDENNKESNNEKINNIDVQSEENISDFAEEVSKDNFNNSNALENNNDNNINDKCNVTCNSNNSDCNITVMEQIKKENKNKNKNKIEKKKESKNDFENSNEDNKSLIKFLHKSEVKENEENTNETFLDNFSNDESEKNSEGIKKNNLGQAGNLENENISNQDAVKLLTYYESITGILGGLNIGFLKVAINAHGYKNVKMAINKSLEVNKANMTYINGILKNWRIEGYPKDDVEVKKNGTGSIGKSNKADKNEFTGFKPKKPRNLTEAERKGAEKGLI